MKVEVFKEIEKRTKGVSSGSGNRVGEETVEVEVEMLRFTPETDYDKNLLKQNCHGYEDGGCMVCGVREAVITLTGGVKCQTSN